MQTGVISAYQPVPLETPIPPDNKQLSRDDWYHLLHLAHTDKSAAFDFYSKYYLTTNEQIYWSDLQQMSEYLDDYVDYLAQAEPNLAKGSLMISEVYVPRDKIEQFIHCIVQDNQQNPLDQNMDLVYGTIRLIEKDDETFLAWAKQAYACIIVNLRVEWSKAGIKKAKQDFQRLIDRALELDGSYFLTYHRWARKDQVLSAYPQFIEFLGLKREYDPQERFQSEWYRYYQKLFKSAGA